MNQTNVNGFEYVKTSGGINEYTMTKNGLTVLLMEDHSAPVATFMVTYHVGSRNEAVGHTGATHLLEHLMFKGSRKFNKKRNTAIWTVLQNIGAQINATTWLDRTNYFELLPSEYLETAIAIEADRMRNAFLNDADRQPEMTVVRNEFERGENDPFEALDKNIWTTAYQAHPYHHSTIGWRSDIENVSTERLKEFYDTYYWPNNATVTIIGDFETEEALSLIKKHFGRYRSSIHEIPVVYTTEPKQEGPRRLTIKRKGQTGIIGVAHKSPAGLHEDTYALQVLSKILGGGRSSRFYKKIVDQGLATGMFMWDAPFKDNGLFITYVFLTPGMEHEIVEKLILEEYELIKNNGVTDKEVQRAQAQIRSDAAFSRDGSYSIASALNEAIAIGDWTFYTQYNEQIASVTPATVQRVANTYFSEDQSTTGYFIPDLADAGNTSLVPSPPQVHQPQFYRTNNNSQTNKTTHNIASGESKTKQTTIAQQIHTSSPVDGLVLKTMNVPVKDVVTITGSLYGGDEFSPENNPLIAELTADMLDEGTTKQTKFDISERLESVGALLSFSSAAYHVRFNARCMKDNIDLVIELLGEQLRSPVFNAEDLDNLKKRKIGSLKRAAESTRTQVRGNFSRIVYPEKHPNYYLPIPEQIVHIEQATVADLKSYHTNYGLGKMTVVAVGDVDDKILTAVLKKTFGDWTISELEMPALTVAAYDIQKTTQFVSMKDKTSVDVIFGLPIGIDREHPDYYPLMIGNYILGGNFSARLMQTVRDQKGLTYGIYSMIRGVNNGNDGYWGVWGTFAPGLLQEGRVATEEQIHLWITGVSEDELAVKKETITGSYKVGLATTRGLASQILTNVERENPDTFLDEYPDIINGIILERVNEVINKYIDPNQLVIVAAGSIDETGRPLEE